MKKEEPCNNLRNNLCKRCRSSRIVVVPRAAFVKYLKQGNALLSKSFCPPNSIHKLPKQ